jgi:hypothetical protein
MYKNDLILVPRIESTASEKQAIEWAIPEKVSVAFMLVDKFGYTVIAKVKVKKKYLWNRSWKTSISHAPAPAEAIGKGLEFLKSFGYTIEYDNDEFEEMISNQDHSRDEQSDGAQP